MSSWLRLEGRSLNLDNAVALHKLNEERYEIVMSDGERFSVFASDLDDVDDVSIIPNETDMEVLMVYLCEDENGKETAAVETFPIIAWKVFRAPELFLGATPYEHVEPVYPPPDDSDLFGSSNRQWCYKRKDVYWHENFFHPTAYDAAVDLLKKEIRAKRERHALRQKRKEQRRQAATQAP